MGDDDEIEGIDTNIPTLSTANSMKTIKRNSGSTLNPLKLNIWSKSSPLTNDTANGETKETPQTALLLNNANTTSLNYDDVYDDILIKYDEKKRKRCSTKKRKRKKKKKKKKS